MSKLLPVNYCELSVSCLPGRKFRMAREKSWSSFQAILTGIAQGSKLRPLRYIFFTADIFIPAETSSVTFADDSLIMSRDGSQLREVEKLQHALNQVSSWTKNWKLKLNSSKSILVTYTLRHHKSNLLSGSQKPKAESTKYFGLHLDNRLKWQQHVRQKAEQMKFNQSQMYWLTA